MARPKLSSPKQPWLVWIPLRVYELLASLKLAVLVIGVSAVVLGWATLVESRYGTEAVHFGIYGTRWFAALNLLLGLNVLCAALIRFPWKRYQTGFVITHAGILVLLVGTLLTRLGGIDAQLPVFEGKTGHLAFKDTQHFELAVYDAKAGDTSSPGDASAASHPSAETASPSMTIEIPFAAGPFNWRDYDERLFRFPWKLSYRDRGVLYDRDGIRLEVLDYLSNSSYAANAPLKLRVQSRGGESGKKTPPAWQTIELGVRDAGGADSPHSRMGLGSREDLPGGPRVVFWIAGSRSETDAFLKSRPEKPLGTKGVIALCLQGEKYEIPLDELKPNTPFPLGDTGTTVELAELDGRFLAAVLRVSRPGEPAGRMILFADVPEFNQQDVEHGLFGTYWADAAKLAQSLPSETTDAKMLDSARRPRVDILQASDGKLYYRTWAAGQFGGLAPLPMRGNVEVFETTGNPVALAVEEFTPSDKPGRRVVPAPFSKQNSEMQTRQARVRLTVDGHSEEFWLEGLPKDPLGQKPQDDQRRVVAGDGRRVAVTLPWDQIDVGFRLFLHKFERKLDPGTSQASWYSSLVDLVDRQDPKKILEEKVLITLNEPVNFSDPRTGRSYRVYQEAFRGPFKPGDQIFDRLVAGQSQRDELFLSWLTFNYDPGRGLKYFGSLLIVAGIGTMFYMRAYFFRRREHGSEEEC
ncbi:MAG: hypothetical protein HUU20_28270 [Pirellulales bacterium]|nr:hypothetical protein [Pirellulales bacterium]